LDLSRKSKLPLLNLSFPTQCIIDTGCINTLVPLEYAVLCGTRLNLESNIIVGGNEYKAQAYSFSDVKFGELKIKRMIGFAAAYKGDLKNRILIGTNFLSNLKITLRKSANEVIVEEELYPPVKDKTYPYVFYFDLPKCTPTYPEYLEEIQES
jgi:hypothetical protein